MISVIVPIYKVEQYLNQCICSIVEQTYKDLEIILVDDGSPDMCPEICDEWAKKDVRIKVLHKKNGGLSDARNAGLSVATGEYIAFVDSDDWIAPNIYERMLDEINKNEADICACGIMACYQERQEAIKVKPIVGNSEEILSLLYADTLYPVSALNKLYRRHLLMGFNFPVGKICEDAFTAYMLVERAEQIVQIETPLYFYRIRENSIMTSAFDRKRMDEEEAWRCNYEYIKQKYPQLYHAAFSFYLKKVNILIHTISKENKKQFEAEYKYLYNILKRNMVYILTSNKFSIKYRIKFVLDFMRL